MISDAELSINDALRRGVRDREKAISAVEAKVEEIASSLGFNWEEEEALKRAALGVSSLPFEFDRAATRRLVEAWRGRKEQELAARTERKPLACSVLGLWGAGGLTRVRNWVT